MSEFIEEEKTELSLGSKIAGWLAIIMSFGLSFNSFYHFVRMIILDDNKPNFNSSFFTELSLGWAHLIFGFLFLAGAYFAFKGIKENKSFNIYGAFVIIFALISLLVSYTAV